MPATPLVACRDHAGVRHHGHPGQLVGGHERLQRRQHRGGRGLVPLERVHRQRKPGRIREQADGDLRVQTAFLGEPRPTEPVPGVGLELQRRDVAPTPTSSRTRSLSSLLVGLTIRASTSCRNTWRDAAG
jgi:hypothetical protein